MSRTNSEILNKNQLPSKLVKYLLFYTKELTPPLYFQRKLALSMAEVPINIHFLLHFNLF